jgi:phosphate-selective porin
MKKITIVFLLISAFASKAQEIHRDTIYSSLRQKVEEQAMKIEGYDERFSADESVLNELAKIKVSGYIQTQYEIYDSWSADGNIHGLGNPVVDNTFSFRRARVKFTYKPIDGVNFVLCPDFQINRVNIKDAYVQLNDRWLNIFSLTVGQFNRPTYEVEYSSAAREFAERTLMTRTLYPSEREQGAKLEADFMTKFRIPLKLQFAIVNGNFGQGAIDNQVKDVDNSKDIMARAVYSISLQKKGLGIDFGAHTYLGNMTVISQTAVPTVFSDENNNAFTPAVGDKLKKQLFGAEMQVYYDFLGGMSLKTEYIRGVYSGTTNPAQVASLFNANKVRNIEGYYLSLIKDVGKNNVASLRYDVFDPNTGISSDAVTKKDDLRYHNWTYAWQYFFNENIKIMASYTMALNEKTQNAGPDFIQEKHDNLFTLRLQAKF